MNVPDVVINASVVGDRPTGLGHYALNLIAALRELGCRPTVLRSAWPLVRRDRGPARHLIRLVWCQTALRLHMMRAAPGAVLLNPLPEGVLSSAVPQVTVLHDLIPLAFPGAYPRQQWYFRRLVPAVLRRSRMIVTTSEATRAEAITVYGLPAERTRAIPCGYDADRFRPEGPKVAGDLPYVLYVGNILPHKNLPRVVEAFTRDGLRTAARLVVAGQGRPHDVDALRRRAREAGVVVDFRSYVAGDELPALYRGARVVVVPSLAEGFGLTALEAMASGTPVIASDTPALREVVDEAAMLVDPRDPARIAQAIDVVLHDDRRHKELVERGLARAAGFSWQRTGRAMLDVLEQVAAR